MDGDETAADPTGGVSGGSACSVAMLSPAFHGSGRTTPTKGRKDAPSSDKSHANLSYPPKPGWAETSGSMKLTIGLPQRVSERDRHRHRLACARGENVATLHHGMVWCSSLSHAAPVGGKVLLDHGDAIGCHPSSVGTVGKCPLTRFPCRRRWRIAEPS